MERVINLLKGSYWMIDVARMSLSNVELNFLKVFFDVEIDSFIDDFSLEERKFLILRKKAKYIMH